MEKKKELNITAYNLDLAPFIKKRLTKEEQYGFPFPCE
jgi:hypothetical protein